MIADIKKNYWNFYVNTKVGTCAKFQLSGLIFIFISCQQLLSTVDSCWQLIWKKLDLYFYVYTKVGTCAEFQLSSLIFIFISCQQLLSAVDSWWLLLGKKIKWNFHLPPTGDTCAKFQLSRLLGGLARECDGLRLTASSFRLTPGKTKATQAQLSFAWAWVEQKNIEIHG